jgi:hypothetical protein
MKRDGSDAERPLIYLGIAQSGAPSFDILAGQLQRMQYLSAQRVYLGQRSS